KKRVSAPLPSVFHAFGFAAAASVLGLFVSVGGRSGEFGSKVETVGHPASASVLEAAEQNQADLLSLHVGGVVEAGGAPLTFSREGVVRWTLLPGSASEVISTGAAETGGVGFSVALLRGEIRAEVTPRDASEGLVEAFAIEVGNTRVAVH